MGLRIVIFFSFIAIACKTTKTLDSLFENCDKNSDSKYSLCIHDGLIEVFLVEENKLVYEKLIPNGGNAKWMDNNTIKIITFSGYDNSKPTYTIKIINDNAKIIPYERANN